MSESVSEIPSVLVGGSLRYQQTVTTEPRIYQQYRPDVDQNRTSLLPHPHFPILHLPHPHPHLIGNITAAFQSNIIFNYFPENESD